MNVTFRSLCLGVALGLASLAAGSDTADAQTQISLRIDTVSVSPDSATVTIPIWIDNPEDVLAGFEVWFQLDRPDMIKFETTIDSLYDTLYWNCLVGVWPNCTDSALVSDTSGGYDFISEVLYEVTVGSYDSSGTLISGWEYVDGRSLSGQGFDVKITAFADLLSPPLTPGIDPQSGGLLFNLIATVLPIPDTLSARTVIIEVDELFLDNLSFADQNGTTLTHELFSGSVTILPPPCCVRAGDANGDNTGPSIADITFLIARIFAGGHAPPCCEAGDANGSGSVNIADVTYMIARIFAGGAAPVCGPVGMGC